MRAILRDHPGELEKLRRIDNPDLHRFVSWAVELLSPERVFVATDSEEDVEYIRKRALESGEEKPLATPGHTVHFDGYYDQARDKERTAILVDEGEDLGPYIRTKERREAVEEIVELMRGASRGKELYICFFVLGPPRSVFTIPALQITDSSYVAHSDFILYRRGYEEFVRQGPRARFMKFLHSAGELDERKTSRNIDKRRIYIDLKEECVYSVNTQYGGNTIGLKKLAFRLTIKRAVDEGWLSEHMALFRVGKMDGVYLTGAYPSMCGKTSTAMNPFESVVGDDLSFIRNVDGVARAVNVEKGVFGIIQGVNQDDDPLIWEVLHDPVEIIFSNVLISGGRPYWSGMGTEIPDEGENHSGKWWRGKKDEAGVEIPPSHKNARFTVDLIHFRNLDRQGLESREGVEVGGFVFGGRDKDTWPPVRESLSWEHGVITMGASLESETTAATLGKEGVRQFNPMAILDFLSVPLGEYLRNYLRFRRELKRPPKIFAVNYFLKDSEGRWLNHKLDKVVWLRWMAARVKDLVDAVKTPIGYLPLHKDLREIFMEFLGKKYSREDYCVQFTIRVPELLQKIERIERIYSSLPNIPGELFRELEEERGRLEKARERWGDYISPFNFC